MPTADSPMTWPAARDREADIVGRGRGHHNRPANLRGISSECTHGLLGIDFSLPITLYLFVVAIGTDYNILIASRLREEFVNGFSPREAVRITVANDAPTVAAAG